MPFEDMLKKTIEWYKKRISKTVADTEPARENEAGKKLIYEYKK